MVKQWSSSENQGSNPGTGHYVFICGIVYLCAVYLYMVVLCIYICSAVYLCIVVLCIYT